ncbi:hypothetical protein OFY05_00765 [Pseudocitrobacter faecalis]|nr:hypothetical protein OFY05_00765 [Pseudocitrobacter faecalis]
MSTNNELLIRLARAAAKTMSLPDADIVTKLCTQLDCALAAARTACGERTAAHSTLEKAREVTNCPQGVDLQDHLKQLAARYDALTAENVTLKNVFGPGDAVLNFLTIALRHTTYDHIDLSDVSLAFQMSLPETTATDSILREAEARGATAAGDYLKLNAQHMSADERLRMQDAAEICYGTAAKLREGKA